MTKLARFFRGVFGRPRYPACYDVAPGHIIISNDSIRMTYWVDDTRARARKQQELDRE